MEDECYEDDLTGNYEAFYGELNTMESWLVRSNNAVICRIQKGIRSQTNYNQLKAHSRQLLGLFPKAQLLGWDSIILSGFHSLLPILLQPSYSKLSALLKPWEGVSTSPPPQKNLLYSSISSLLYIYPYRQMPAKMKPKFTPPLKYYRVNLCE